MFIDETSVKTNMTRLRGRSSRGQRLEMNAPFGAWGTQTFIAGLTHDSLIAPWVIKGAMDGEAFAAYMESTPKRGAFMLPFWFLHLISCLDTIAGTSHAGCRRGYVFGLAA